MRKHQLPASALLLATTLVTAAIAACGGGNENTTGPQTPSATPSASGTAPAGTSSTPTPTPSGSTTPAGTGSSTASTPPSTIGPMKPIKASAMEADLKAIGLDIKKLPPLNKLEPDKLRKVMQTFKTSLGVQCTGCHDANDFKAATPNKKVATHMWNDWVRGLTMEDGSPLYCDSCHQGSAKFLDRHDKKALSGWMDANFVSKLKRADKKEHGCETCHGDPFEPKLLDKWEK
jgi:hypothetical protein